MPRARQPVTAASRKSSHSPVPVTPSSSALLRTRLGRPSSRLLPAEVQRATAMSDSATLASMDRDDPAYRGQADYSELLLWLYDPLVLGPIARYVWRWPVDRAVRTYRQHIRPNHLDIGPGTGYFIAHAGLSAGSKVTILDPNPTVLRHVTRRLRDLDITAVEADVLKPLPLAGPFASAGLNAVLHCLPGPLDRKATAIANIAAVLAPDATLFGA